MIFGMDPEVTKYFKKIIKSLFAGLLWLMINIIAGLYYALAYSKNYPGIVHVVFYIWLTGSLIFLLIYFYKLWSK
jgi:hypothetical protein